MLQNAYFLAKIGADTAENEQHFAEILPIGRRVADPCRAAYRGRAASRPRRRRARCLPAREACVEWLKAEVPSAIVVTETKTWSTSALHSSFSRSNFSEVRAGAVAPEQAADPRPATRGPGVDEAALLPSALRAGASARKKINTKIRNYYTRIFEN